MSTSSKTGPHETTYGEILRLAWPASVAAAITPMLGAVDVWALARSDRPLDVAAVALGSVIFSLAYWTFGFIRMSVAGLTAQAAGGGDEVGARANLAVGAAIGGGVGIIMLALQIPIGMVSFHLLAIDSQATDTTFSGAETYYNIRIWGAPFALASYALFGWMTARGRTDFLMASTVLITGMNIVLDYWFVVGLGMGPAGVAAGTLIAEVSGFFICVGFILLMLRDHGGISLDWSIKEMLDKSRMKKTISVNFDIFIRTLLLAFCFAWFVQQSGTFGDVTLAANQVLLQIVLIAGLALDGTAIAAETLVGQTIGGANTAGARSRYQATVRRSMITAVVLAVILTIMTALGGSALVDFLTPAGAIRKETMKYLLWAVASPLAVVIGFQLDGIFIGATRAREMRDSMILTTLAFIPATLMLSGQFGNHGLWGAFMLYFILRAVTLSVYLPRIRQSFEKAAPAKN